MAAVIGVLVGAIVVGAVAYVALKPKSAAATPGPLPPVPGPGPGIVVWDPNTASQDLAITGPQLIKTGMFDGWNEVGAVSLQTVSGDGFVKLIAPSVNPRAFKPDPGFGNFPISRGSLVFGITTSDSINDVTNIDYGIKLNDDGSYQIVENGATVLDPNYIPGDDMRVQVTNGHVTYLQNGNIIYTSLKPLNANWKAAAAIFTIGQQVSNIQIQGQTI